MASRWIWSRASSPTTEPSRRTTTRSAQVSTSFSRWVMKMIDTPSALSSPITRISRSVSVDVRLEVGSSMMTMRALSESALAISSSWRWASDRSETRSSTSKSTSSRFSNGATIRFVVLAVDELKGTARQRLPPDQHIRPDVEIVEKVQFLMNEGDSGAQRFGDGERAVRGAVDLDRSLIGLHHPAEDLHQRRLARAVLADQRENLAPVHGQADTRKRADAGVGLADVDQPKEGIGQIRSLRKNSAARRARGAGIRAASKRCSSVRSSRLISCPGAPSAQPRRRRRCPC